ncbi:MAG: hypothetical protein ACI4I3_01950 [Acutalibacteraceae bacterium]
MDVIQAGKEKLQSGDFEEAARLFAQGFFAHGNVRAGCYLAQMYYDKIIPPKDKVHDAMAMILWQITANKGQASSMHRLGIAYQKSDSVSINQKGVNYLKSAYENGHESSATVLGLISYMRNDYAQACNYFSKVNSLENDKTAFFAYSESLIKKTNPDVRKGIQMLRISALEHNILDAAILLYKLYCGDMVQEIRKDEQEMMRYLKLRADLNDPEACEEYGLKLFDKDDSYEGETLALSYLEKAKDNLSVDGVLATAFIYWKDFDDTIKAEKTFLRAFNMASNNSTVNYKVGHFYFYTKRYDQAIPYLETAFNLGENDAAELLFDAYSKLSRKENAIKLAIYMQKNDLVPHDRFAFFDYIIGISYISGELGLEINFNLGIAFLLNSAEAGNTDAMDALGELYISSDSIIVGLGKNEAEKWLHKSYENGSSDAAYLLGEFYIKQYQAVQAVQWLTRAYNEFGDKDAANELANLYEQGFINGRKDKKNAKFWRDRALYP